jgi:thiamine pyrophosphate-dependent acetolactate synthase large subunit-like protein
MNGADRLCDVLLANDVDVCFANPGTSEMHFVAALDRKPQRARPLRGRGHWRRRWLRPNG